MPPALGAIKIFEFKWAEAELLGVVKSGLHRVRFLLGFCHFSNCSPINFATFIIDLIVGQSCVRLALQDQWSCGRKFRPIIFKLLRITILMAVLLRQRRIVLHSSYASRAVIVVHNEFLSNAFYKLRFTIL